MNSPVSFLGTASATPVKFAQAVAPDTSSFLPEEAVVRRSLIRAAKANAESAIANALEAGVPDTWMGDLRAERFVVTANFRAVEDYVETLRGPVEALAPADVKGETLANVRADIEKVETRMQGLMLQGLNRAEQIDRLKMMVEATASNCAPETFRLARENWNAPDPAMAFRELLGVKGDAFALLALVAGDAIIEKLSALVPADDDGQLPSAERLEAIANCRAELRRLGWIEETILRAAATPPLRRENALAEALLGVAIAA